MLYSKFAFPFSEEAKSGFYFIEMLSAFMNLSGMNLSWWVERRLKSRLKSKRKKRNTIELNIFTLPCCES